MKRLLRIAVVLLACACAGLFYLKNTATVTAWLMVFNQNSTQSIMGVLNKAENTALMAVFLSAFQAFAMPWKKVPRIAIASSAVLGFVPALLLCLLGRLIAISLWYLIGRLLFGFKFKFNKEAAFVFGAVACILPAWAAPAALLAAAVSAPFGYCLGLSALAQLFSLGFYAKFGNIYSSIIPAWCGSFMYGLAAVVLVVGIVLFIKKRK